MWPLAKSVLSWRSINDFGQDNSICIIDHSGSDFCVSKCESSKLPTFNTDNSMGLDYSYPQRMNEVIVIL